MKNQYNNLFSPITIGTMKLKNRIVLAPMSVHITPPDGSITDREIAFYKRKAKGGAGLIIIGSVLIRADGNFGGQIFIDNDSRIPGLKRMTDAIHQAGAKISAQIHHAGRETNIATCGYQPVSASVFEPETEEYDLPRALTTREVGDYVEYYAQGVRRAKEAGFDAVELHGAHGYLIAQFMSPLTNFRSDQYGGSFLGRMRFIKEIITRSRELVGDDFTITVRISGDELRPNGIDMHLSREIAKYLEKLGVAAISVSAQMYPYVRTCPNMYHKPGVNVYLAENIKEVVKVPVITAGRINTPELAEEIISSGKADLVCMGRVLLADPDFPKKAQEGRSEEIITCIACNKGCHDRNAEDRAVKCTMNPETGREGTFKILPAKESKKVLIVGGGPAGMEAARVATLRGHDVELYEQNEELGGRLILASIPPNKTGYAEAVEYFKEEIDRLKVKVHLGVRVNKGEIMKQNPDAVILATGAHTLIPNIPGVDQTFVVDSDEILAGKKEAGKHVVVIGGGSVGAETAHYLMVTAQREVFLVEMLPDIAADMPQDAQIIFSEELKRNTDLKVLTNSKVVKISENSVTIEKDNEEQEIKDIDTVVLASGAVSNNSLAQELKNVNFDVYSVGDALKPKDATKAIYEGAIAAIEI